MASFVPRTLLVPLAAAACVLVRPCLADAAPAPAATCTLLMGGGGTVTPDKDVNSRWVSLNSILARHLGNDLTKLGYRVQDFIVDIENADARSNALQAQLQKTGCGQVLELTHELTADPSKPGTFSKFTFVVSVLDLQSLVPTSKIYRRMIRIAEKYNTGYEYPMTPHVLEKLSLTDLAQTMADDVDKARVLQK